MLTTQNPSGKGSESEDPDAHNPILRPMNAHDIAQSRDMLLADPEAIPDAMKIMGDNTPSPELGIAAYQILFLWNARRMGDRFPSQYRQIETAALAYVNALFQKGLDNMDVAFRYFRVFGTTLPNSILDAVGLDRNTLNYQLYQKDAKLRGAPYSPSMASEDAVWGKQALEAWAADEVVTGLPPSFGKTPYVGSDNSTGDSVSSTPRTKPRAKSIPVLSRYERAFLPTAIHDVSLKMERRNIFLYLAAYEQGLFQLRESESAAAYPSILNQVTKALQEYPEYARNAPTSFSPPSLKAYIQAKPYNPYAMNGWSKSIRTFMDTPEFKAFLLQHCTEEVQEETPVVSSPAPMVVETPKVAAPVPVATTTSVATLLETLFAEIDDAQVSFDYPRVTITSRTIPLNILFRPGITAEVNITDGVKSVTFTQKD